MLSIYVSTLTLVLMSFWWDICFHHATEHVIDPCNNTIGHIKEFGEILKPNERTVYMLVVGYLYTLCNS